MDVSPPISSPTVSPDLIDEISALNCIYGPDSLTGPLPTSSSSTSTHTLTISSSPTKPVSSDPDTAIFLLHPPTLPIPITFKISIPHTYPSGGIAPNVLSLSVEGRPRRRRDRRRRKDADADREMVKEEKEEARWLDTARDVMAEVYDANGRAGVCLYEFVERMAEVLPPAEEEGEGGGSTAEELAEAERAEKEKEVKTAVDRGWVISEYVTDRKSVFVARAVKVESAEDAKAWVEELVSGDKRLEKATHNMYAYRIKGPNPSSFIQDNDDDGETAAGNRLAHLLTIMDVSNVCVVVSRWYGGIKLGGDRFRIIGAVGREAIVRLLAQQGDGKEKEKEGGKEKGGKGKKSRR